MERLQTWVINLDRAPERLQRIASQLDRLGLRWQRLPAFDARALTPAQQGRLDVAAYRRLHGKDPVPGELGCYLSHLEAMNRFLASDAEFALVFEDDSIVLDSLPAVLQGLVANGARWDMVKLSAVHSGTPVRVLEVAPGHHLGVMLSRCTGASAYVVNRRAAQAYVDRLLPMQLPWDLVFDQGWLLGLRVRLVLPTPCVHDDQIQTTIPMPKAKRQFHWTRRLSTYAYRIGNESRRLAYGISQALREKLAS